MPEGTEAMDGPTNKPLPLRIDAAIMGLGMYGWNGRKSVADRRSAWSPVRIDVRCPLEFFR